MSKNRWKPLGVIIEQGVYLAAAFIAFVVFVVLSVVR